MENGFDFNDFYRQHYEAAVRYATMLVFNEDDANDVVSGVILSLIEMEEKLSHQGNVSGLFITMVHNRCIDHLRRAARRKRYEDYVKYTADNMPDDELNALCHREMFRIVGETLENMPSVRRNVMIDVRMNGLSYREVEEKNHISKRVVEYQLHKAEADIQNHLQKMYG